MNYYYEHVLVPNIPDENLTNTSTAQVFEKINLRNLCKELDIDISVMKTLNPSYIRNYIPKSEEGVYNLVLPTTEMRIVAAKYHVLATLPELKEKKEMLAEEEATLRPTLIIEDIPPALFIGDDGKNPPTQLYSLRAYSVRLGSEEEFMEYEPDQYILKEKKYSVSYFNHVIKKNRKSL